LALERALSFAAMLCYMRCRPLLGYFRREEFDRTLKAYIDSWDKLEAKLP
jgi:hypothetical protein